jgi:hypothetical protein
MLNHCRNGAPRLCTEILRNDMRANDIYIPSINARETGRPIEMRGHGDQPPLAFCAPAQAPRSAQTHRINGNRIFQVAIRPYLPAHNCIERF